MAWDEGSEKVTPKEKRSFVPVWAKGPWWVRARWRMAQVKRWTWRI